MAIRQQAAGRVLVVTIDAPDVRNAFDKATIASLRALFEELAFRDPLPPTGGEVGPGGRHRPHAVVLAATGAVFCAGAHLGEMKELGAADYQENMTAALDMGAMFRAVRACPVPVVARVQGPAYGGGVGSFPFPESQADAMGASFDRAVITFPNGSGGVGIDNLAYVAVPAPGTLALAAFGVLGLRRRR